MKRCPTCNRTYTDPNLSYCVDDGTPLTTKVVEDESTVVSPSATERNDDWNAAAYRVPAYVPPGKAPEKRRKVWPWVVGLVSAFLLGVVGLMIAAAIFVPRYVRSRQADQPVVVTTDTNTNETTETETPNTPPPTDETQVLAQLTDVENEWTVANLNADKQKLDRILADDYVGPSAAGDLQGKQEYIDTIERDTTVEKWQFDDLKVLLSGDRATLTGKITYVTQGQEAVFDFTDKFVWRDGRWQATGSEVKRRE